MVNLQAVFLACYEAKEFLNYELIPPDILLCPYISMTTLAENCGAQWSPVLKKSTLFSLDKISFLEFYFLCQKPT